MNTKSGKKPEDIKVKIVLTGETYPVKYQLKLSEYKWDSRLGEGWTKVMNLAETVNEIQSLVSGGIIKAKIVTPTIRPMDKETDGKDVYFFTIDYLDKLW